MTKRATEQAERLLREHVDRTERCGSDASGGWCLTAHWTTGGQRVFYTLDQVRTYLREREWLASMTK